MQCKESKLAAVYMLFTPIAIFFEEKIKERFKNGVIILV